MHNRGPAPGAGPKSLSEALKQGKVHNASAPKSLAQALKGGGKAKKGGITSKGVDDVKTSVTFGGKKAKKGK